MLLTDGAPPAAFGEPQLILSNKATPKKKVARLQEVVEALMDIEGHMRVISFAYIC